MDRKETYTNGIRTERSVNERKNIHVMTKPGNVVDASASAVSWKCGVFFAVQPRGKPSTLKTVQQYARVEGEAEEK